MTHITATLKQEYILQGKFYVDQIALSDPYQWNNVIKPHSFEYYAVWIFQWNILHHIETGTQSVGKFEIHDI
jgi:hypothetical protein